MVFGDSARNSGSGKNCSKEVVVPVKLRRSPRAIYKDKVRQKCTISVIDNT